MGIWDQAGYNSKHCERLNLQVGCLPGAVLLVQSNQAVVLLIDIQVFHKALFQKLRKAPLLALDLQVQ